MGNSYLTEIIPKTVPVKDKLVTHSLLSSRREQWCNAGRCCKRFSDWKLKLWTRTWTCRTAPAWRLSWSLNRLSIDKRPTGELETENLARLVLCLRASIDVQRNVFLCNPNRGGSAKQIRTGFIVKFVAWKPLCF